MSTFLKIQYVHRSIGRVELWMEGTGKFDEDGMEIFEAVREPTEEDLLYAERTSAWKIRYIHAIIQCFLPPCVLQTAFESELYDEDVPGSALAAFLNLHEVANREVQVKLREMIREGSLGSLPEGSLFNAGIIPKVTWTSIFQPKKDQP